MGRALNSTHTAPGTEPKQEEVILQPHPQKGIESSLSLALQPTSLGFWFSFFFKNYPQLLQKLLILCLQQNLQQKFSYAQLRKK